MIVISNQQRDDIVRYLDLLCDELKKCGQRDTRSYNTRRRAAILRKQLIKRQTVPASELPEQVKNFRAFK